MCRVATSGSGNSDECHRRALNHGAVEGGLQAERAVAIKRDSAAASVQLGRGRRRHRLPIHGRKRGQTRPDT
jgi:hypothetical protein